MAQAGVNIIIFGGCGFVGRNLVEYLIENSLSSLVRVVDKVPPQVAWLNRKHKKIFDDYRVEFFSANLINKDSAENAFKDAQFDYAINCACETKLGQSERVYEEGIFKVSINCALASAKHNVKNYIEISSGHMFNAKTVAHKESDTVEPWTEIALQKFLVEIELKNIKNLNYTIIRPGIVYGIGDISGLGSRLIIPSVYKYLGEKMTVMWTNELFINTVHVSDLCRAIHHLYLKEGKGEVYNVVDDGHTNQGMLCEAIKEVFSVEYDFWGKYTSAMFRLGLDLMLEEVNDKHMAPWAKICLENNVANTPLSPYIHSEVIRYKNLNLDNTKIKSTGFQFDKPKLSSQLIKEIIDDYVDSGMFPKSLLS